MLFLDFSGCSILLFAFSERSKLLLFFSLRSTLDLDLSLRSVLVLGSLLSALCLAFSLWSVLGRGLQSVLLRGLSIWSVHSADPFLKTVDFSIADMNFFRCFMYSGKTSKSQWLPFLTHNGSYFCLDSSKSCLPWEQSTTSSAVPWNFSKKVHIYQLEILNPRVTIISHPESRIIWSLEKAHQKTGDYYNAIEKLIVWPTLQRITDDKLWKGNQCFYMILLFAFVRQ